MVRSGESSVTRPRVPSQTTDAAPLVPAQTCQTPPASTLVPCRDVGFVDLDRSAQRARARAAQSRDGACAATPTRSGSRPTQAPAGARARTLPASGSTCTRSREPAHQRRARPGEDRAGGDQSLRAADRAAAQPVPHLPPASGDRSTEPTHEPTTPSNCSRQRRQAASSNQSSSTCQVTRIVHAHQKLISHDPKLGPAGDGRG